MKKIIMSLAASLVSITTAFSAEVADNSLYIVSDTVTAGTSFNLSVCLKNSEEDVQSIGFDLALPTGMQVDMDNDALVIGFNSQRTTPEQHAIYTTSSVTTPRIAVLQKTGNAISGVDGESLVVAVNVDESMLPGDYDVVITGAELSGRQGIIASGGSYTARITVASSTGVDDVTADTQQTSGRIYTLSGVEVKQTVPGRVYVKDGKTFVAR